MRQKGSCHWKCHTVELVVLGTRIRTTRLASQSLENRLLRVKDTALGGLQKPHLESPEWSAQRTSWYTSVRWLPHLEDYRAISERTNLGED